MNLKVNGFEIRRFTVFYRCDGVERIVEVLKNIESAVVDDKVIEEMAKRILKNLDRNKTSFNFDLNVRMRYKDAVLEFDDPVRIYVKCKVVEEPDYIAVSATPNTVRVLADFKREESFVRDVCKEIARHIPRALGLKNAVEFVDLDTVRTLFNEKINEISLNVGSIVDILRDFTEIVLKDFEDRIVIGRGCELLRYLNKLKCVVFVIDCPFLLDKIVERVKLGRLSGKELRRLRIERSSVIRSEEFILHMLKVIG